MTFLDSSALIEYLRDDQTVGNAPLGAEQDAGVV
jgi:hypothetical protein